MKELGQFLKTEREKQGLSLEDLASRTKIHIQKLKDIEDGNREALPAKVFCIGLIKSYARELKVDTKAIDQLCQQAFFETPPAGETIPEPTPAPKQVPVQATTEVEDDDNAIGRFKIPKAVGIGAGLLICGILIFAIVQVIEKMNSYSQEEALPQEVFQTIENPAETTEIEPEQTEEVSATAKEASIPTPEPEKETTTTEEPKPEPAPKVIQAKPALEKPVVEPEPKPKPESVTTEEDFSEDNFGAPDPSEDSKPDVAVSDNKLTVTALEPVRAEVVWSDGYVQVMLLKSQESKTLVFSKPITLRVNNGGAVQVSFNESEKKVPGTFNQPIEIKYP